MSIADPQRRPGRVGIMEAKQLFEKYSQLSHRTFSQKSPGGSIRIDYNQNGDLIDCGATFSDRSKNQTATGIQKTMHTVNSIHNPILIMGADTTIEH